MKIHVKDTCKSNKIKPKNMSSSKKKKKISKFEGQILKINCHIKKHHILLNELS